MKQPRKNKGKLALVMTHNGKTEQKWRSLRR